MPESDSMMSSARRFDVLDCELTVEMAAGVFPFTSVEDFELKLNASAEKTTSSVNKIY